LKNYTWILILVSSLNSNASGGWDIYIGWMIQEMPRKYIKPTYIKDSLQEDPRLDGKMK